MDPSIEMLPSEAPKELSDGTTVACVILGLSFLVGVPGNLLVIWTILRHVKQRFHTVVLILHLAVADMMVLITLPVWIYSLVNTFVFGSIVCKILMCVITVCMFSSIFFITLMSVERYLAICHPFLMMRWKTEKNMNRGVAFLWLFALLLGLLDVLTQTFAESDKNEQCFVRDFNNKTQEIAFLCLQTLLGFVLPFIILSICYCLVAAQLKKMSFNSKQKSKILIHTVVLVFLLCWLPYHVINVIDVVCIFGSDTEHECVPESFVFSSGALVFISSSVNPVLYAFFARNFRGSLGESGLVKLFQELASNTNRLRDLAVQQQDDQTPAETAMSVNLVPVQSLHKEEVKTCFFGSRHHSQQYFGRMNNSHAPSLLEEMAPEAFDEGTVVACVILGLSFLVGTPGNLLVIWTILRNVKQRSHTVVLILHLAVADLVVLITLPLWIYSFAQSWVFGLICCRAIVFVMNASMYSSVFLITLMSVERFVAVRYPFVSVVWKRKQALNKVLLALWSAAFLFSIPIILTQTVGEDDGKTNCLVREYTSNTQELVCLLLELVVGYMLPFSILVVCYGCLCSRITQMTFRSKRKSTVLIASIVIAFAICWTPHQIGNIISIIILAIESSFSDTAQKLETARQTMYFIAGAMIFISNSINPVLYMFAARSFRESLRDTGIQKLFRHISSTSPGEGNREVSFVSRRQNSQTISSQFVTQSKDEINMF
ncbi:LOW QUALITY PROTEIN: uncharacterized protein FYW61_022015 [Anableps anableps]